MGSIRRTVGAKGRNGEAGFTLIELMVVLALLTLVYAIAFPAVSMLFDNPRADRARDAVTDALADARREAITRVRGLRFTVGPDGRTWRYGAARGEAPSGTVLELSGGGGSEAILFHPDGTSSGGRITLTSGQVVRVVTVDWLTGRAGP